MNNYLMLPMHVDALHLKNPQPLVQSTSDFSKLPYANKNHDINSNIANISVDIASQPFQNQNFNLSAGVYLHWALPSALTHGTEIDNKTIEYPAAPNRWLVTRRRNDQIEKQWVVESDYIHSIDDDTGKNNSVCVPYHPNYAYNHKEPPFRYLGRQLLLDEWIKAEYDPLNYVDKVTALGYVNKIKMTPENGETDSNQTEYDNFSYENPTFAAFFPSCYSVFGFHDNDEEAMSSSGACYEVVGWYSNHDDDHLQQSIKKDPSLLHYNEKAEKTVLESFNCEVAAKLPSQDLSLLYYAQLTFSGDNTHENTNKNNKETIISVGNTSIEALSAFLADKLKEKLPDNDTRTTAHLERELDAIYSASQIKKATLDIDLLFREDRHKKIFKSLSEGYYWEIIEQELQDEINQDNANKKSLTQLPEAFAVELHELNILLQYYNRIRFEATSQRELLFADWFKYMVCAYPPSTEQADNFIDVDQVKHYIEQHDIKPLEQALRLLGIFDIENFDPFNFDPSTLPYTAEEFEKTLIAWLLNKLEDLYSKLSSHNELLKTQHEENKNKTSLKQYTLKLNSSQRFWQAYDPVILMTGDAVKPSKRYANGIENNKKLNCSLITLDCKLDNTNKAKTEDELKKISSKIKILKEVDPNNQNIAFNLWQEQPWNPILLEWEVSLFPMKKSVSSTNYDPEFITHHYRLQENRVELTPHPDTKIHTTKGANVYTGSSLLSPHASGHLRNRIQTYLDLPSHEQNERLANLATLANQLFDEYQLDHSLSQVLDGFNGELLMHQRIDQMNIAEPLGFPSYQAFTNKVNELVAGEGVGTPQSLNDFNPIRSGVMKVHQLRLIDTFGQVKDLSHEGDYHKAITTDSLSNTGTNITNADGITIGLPPRLVQPARLNFSWLSAKTFDVSPIGGGNPQKQAIFTNSHTATSPICGWVIPNNVSQSLIVCGAEGEMIGSIVQFGNAKQARFVAPLSNLDKAIEDIANPHLRKVVKHIVGANEQYLAAFIETLNAALNNIDPESFAQHQSIALLSGRPIAIVRGQLNLEIKGLPAVDLGWNVFRQDLQRETRESRQFTQVKFPIRLGEYHQLNDGLIGYWEENEDMALSSPFFVPQSDTTIQHKAIRTHTQQTNNQGVESITTLQSIDDPARTFTLLFDPRATLHITSGILPSKVLDIPESHYQAALAAIEVYFLITPILSGKDDLSIPLPVIDEEYQWSWVEKQLMEDRSQEAELIEIKQADISQPDTQRSSTSEQKKIREGWLKLSKANTNKTNV